MDEHRYAIYVGFVIPRDMALKHLNSLAGNEAEMNFVQHVLCHYHTYVCSYPYHFYAAKKPLYQKEEAFELPQAEQCICHALPILNIPLIKRMWASRDLKRYLERTIREIREKDREADIRIITCNSYPLFSEPALKVAKEQNVELISYLIDGYYYQGIFNIRRRINEKLSQRNLKRYDKVIALSENVAKTFCKAGQTYTVITPIHYEEQDKDYVCPYFDKDTFNLMFAGGIFGHNGIHIYCDAAKSLPQGQKFHLFGRGELAEDVAKQAETCEQLAYHGVIAHEELMKVEQAADLLVILRPTDGNKPNNITKYGIPFKLIEYLQSGVPVLASPMEAIPSYLLPYIHFCKADTPSALQAIEDIVSHYDEALQTAQEARRFMKENCSWTQYGKTLKEFMYGER